MPKFTAGSAVSALEWDFTKYQPSDAIAPWAGTVPEPSVEDIETFQAAVQAVAPTGDASRLSEVGSDAKEAFEALISALAALCKGSPSQAQLRALPFRVLVAFLGFLIGQLGNPQ